MSKSAKKKGQDRKIRSASSGSAAPKPRLAVWVALVVVLTAGAAVVLSSVFGTQKREQANAGRGSASPLAPQSGTTTPPAPSPAPDKPAAASPPKSEPATPPTKPDEPQAPADLNLLLITLDTTRADALGCYGSMTAKTPNLDRFAAEGARFTHCNTCTPITLPAHCTILTGTYPFVHGVRQNGPARLDASNVTLAEMLTEAGFASHAIISAFTLKGMFGLRDGFAGYDDAVILGDQKMTEAERRANQVTDLAIRRLPGLAAAARAAYGGQRFFLWVHYYDPHYPYQSQQHPDPASAEAYADEVTFMDQHVGRLVDELSKLGLDRKTLVVIAGDHGEGLGDHGEQEHGYLAYQSTLHVPLIFRCPGVIPAGRVLEPQVRTVDILPTILDYLGRPISGRLQGISLRDLINGKAGDPGLMAYGESLTASITLGLSQVRSLTADGWKYLHSSRPELYRLPDDPREEHNLIAEQPERAARMLAQLKAIVAQTAGPGTESPSAGMTQADIDRLSALGYVTSSGGTSTAVEELAGFDLEGENPADRMKEIRQFADAHRMMAEERYAAAEGIFRSLLTVFPDSQVLLMEITRILRKQRRENEMVSVCEEALAARPDAAVVRRHYASLLLESGNIQEAVVQLDKIVSQNPQDVDAQVELGDALRGLKQFEDARLHYQEALDTKPDDTRAMHGLAKVCMAQDQLPEAAEYLRRALEIFPASTPMKQDYKQVLERMKSKP